MPRAALTVLGLVIALFALMGVTQSASSSTIALHGDTDCNGAVEHQDILPVLEHLAMLVDTSGCNPNATDIDCDGDTDSDDALDLLFYFEALPGPTPAPGCYSIGSPLPTPITPTPVDTTPIDTTAPATVTEPTTPTPVGTGATEPPPTETPTETPQQTGTQTPEDTPEVTGTPTATPPFCPQGIPTASPKAPAPTGTPAPGGYHILQLMQCADFIAPTDFAAIPGHPGEALVTTQSGLVWRVSVTGQFEPTLAADLRDRVQRVSDEGLLSIAFQPGNDDYVYVNYNRGTAYNTDDTTNPTFGDPTSNRCDLVPGINNPPDPKRSRVARFSFTNNKLVKNSEHVVMEIQRPHCWHNISQLAFDPRVGHTDILYIGSGDGGGIGSRFDNHADPLINKLGVIMRIRILPNGNYQVPADNPFVGDTSHPEIWAVEFRHPWRVSVDSETGDVWTGDVGQEKFEEIDKVEAGGNYGWNKMEGTHCYPPSPTPNPSITPTPSPTPFPPPCYDNDFTMPVAEYDHGLGCAVAVGPVYRGDAMPELDGYLIYGDYCSGRIWGLDTTDNDPTPIELINTPKGIISLGQTGDGEVVILDKDGAIHQLVRN